MSLSAESVEHVALEPSITTSVNEMKSQSVPRVVYAERLCGDVIIEFDNGEYALYPAALLIAMLPQAVKIDSSEFEEDESEPIQ